MKISIVVPVYNTAEYLAECLDSLITQTCGEFEIVCVNDGSTDESSDILREYQLNHPELIKVITQENEGLSEARNTGIAFSKGEYIAFVDSDDYILPDMMKLLYDKATSGNFDVTVCDVMYKYPNKTINLSSKVSCDLTDKDAIKYSMLSIYPTAWNKLYRSELLKKGVLFKKGILYEDFEFLYRLYPHINSIGTVKSPMYFYRQRPGAITRTYDRRLFQCITNFDSIIKYYKENDFYEEYKKQLEYLFVKYSYGTMPKRLARSGNYQLYAEGVSFAQRQVKRNFPEYRKNPIFRDQSAIGLYLLLFNWLISRLLYIKERMLPGI